MTVPGTSAMCAEESLNGSKPRSRFTARTLPKESEVQDEKLGDKEFILRGITRVRTTEREEATSNVRLSDTCPNSCPIPQQPPLRAMWIACHSYRFDSLSEL